MNNYSKEKNQIKWIEDKIDKALDPHDPVNFYYNLKLLWRCSNEFDRDILIECFLFRYAILNQRIERKKRPRKRLKEMIRNARLRIPQLRLRGNNRHALH